MLYHTYQSPFNQKIENPSRGRKLSFNFLLVCYLLIIRRQRTPVGDGNPIYTITCNQSAIYIRRQRTPVGDGNLVVAIAHHLHFIYQKIENPSRGRKPAVRNQCSLYFPNQKIENPSRGRKLSLRVNLFAFAYFLIRRQRTPVGDGNFLFCCFVHHNLNPLEDREPQQGTETIHALIAQYHQNYQKIENPSRGRKPNSTFFIIQYCF